MRAWQPCCMWRQLVPESAMRDRPLSQVTRSFVISLAWNGVLLMLPALFDPRQFPVSTLGRIVDALGAPGGIIVEHFFPGHDLIQVVIMLTCSVVFYSLVAWVGLTAWTAFRRSSERPTP
jgi:hypothetical protein